MSILDTPHKILPLHIVESTPAYLMAEEKQRRVGGRQERERRAFPRLFTSQVRYFTCDKTQNPVIFVSSVFCQLPFASNFNILRAT